MKSEYCSIPILVLSISYLFSNCSTGQNGTEVSDYKMQVQTMESPAGRNASLPYLTTGQGDRLYLSWVETHDDSVIFRYAVRNTNNWNEVREIASGHDLFVNWADYPMLSVNRSGGIMANYMMVTSEEKFSNDIHMMGKTQSGDWSPPAVPHTDRSLVQHGFVSLVPDADDLFHIAWLDGRNGGSEGDEHYGEMTLQAVVANLDGKSSEEVVLDDYVCSCCQTGGAMTKNGPIIVYRDRSSDEVRDISIVRLVDGSWTKPQNIHDDGWTIAGCPVNGPRADAIDNDLAIAWFTMAGNRPTVKVVFSPDGGASFGEPIIIDDKSPIGRVDLVLLDNERALVSWLSTKNEQTFIKARMVHRSGELEPPFDIAETSASRKTGFPQMANHGSTVYFAWTHLTPEEGTEIKLVTLNIN